MDSNSEEIRKISLSFNQHPCDFGLATFTEPAVLNRAFQDKHTIDGRTVGVKKALPREKQQTNVCPKYQYLIDNSDVSLSKTRRMRSL